ncbi:MAG: RNA 2',3'-cyclic phosphodiesterase [Rhodocyclaceae bacterium]|nr:RNA 2',3'-cyclic phosphodiesterase [Rhodocyclaceae bacterium]
MPEGFRRVFFALWPDAAAAGLLHTAGREARETCGGRLMRRETLHLTLAFLGDIPAQRIDDARRAADGIAAAPFALTLDRLGFWPGNPILWAGAPESIPRPALTLLADALGGRLREAGFRLEDRPFAAHVTLLRDARCPAVPTLANPVEWTASEFVLAESVRSAEGSRYETIGRWPLTPPE